MASTWFGLWSIYRQLRSVPNNGKATFPHSRTFSCALISRSSFLVRCVLGISCEWQYASPCPPTPPTESLRASVSHSRAIWQGLTLAVTTDGTFDRHRCLCVHLSMWEDSSKHRSASPMLPTMVTHTPLFFAEIWTPDTHAQQGGPAGYETVCLC